MPQMMPSFWVLVFFFSSMVFMFMLKMIFFYPTNFKPSIKSEVPMGTETNFSKILEKWS